MTENAFRVPISFSSIVTIAFSMCLAEVDAQVKVENDDRYVSVVAPFIRTHCHRCHNEQQREGELHLASLNPDMETSSATRWAIVRAKLTSGEMPPEDEPRPDTGEIDAVVGWIDSELKRAGKHFTTRQEYDNGNRVPHDLLFGSATTFPFDGPARARRLSPMIYDRTVLQGEGKGVRGVVQPFTTPGGTTFKDMGTPKIDEPTTSALMRNALAIVEKQSGHKFENGEFKKVGRGEKEFLVLFDPETPPSKEQLVAAIELQFRRVLKRKPTDEEAERFIRLYEKTTADAGRALAAKYMLAAVFLLPDTVYRWELGHGTPDEAGRVRLAPREIALAISYALTDDLPAESLLADANNGEFDTAEGVAEAVRRMLADPKLKKPAISRFFREYFDYEKAVEVFKAKDPKNGNFHRAKILVADTDQLIQSILEQDKNVLYELLTTEKSFVEYRAAAEKKKQRAEALEKFLAKKAENPEKFKNKKPPKPHASTYLSYNQPGFSAEQPVTMPSGQRSGVLTQPAWLVAHSKSDENDAIRRGKWIRERLLGGVVPDLPITVDAQLPNAPEQTLRERMAVTREEYCWQCHTSMNRLGLPFENYDHFGRYRETEEVLDPVATENNVDKKGKHLGPIMREVAVDATGGIEHVSDASLEGDVDNALALLHRLAQSEYVEQVFVRHAFRFWMGRNETPGDAPSLQAAHRAYRESGGSMNAMIVALLSSDSFLYRVESASPQEVFDAN